MDSDPELLQEHPLAEVPEYDVVTFDLNESRWRNHLPPAWEAEWSKKLPLAYIARTYAGLTTGSERTVLRSPTDEHEGAPRPDLNLLFDQISYHPGTQSLFCFTGGLTASYNVVKRRWSDLHSCSHSAACCWRLPGLRPAEQRDGLVWWRTRG